MSENPPIEFAFPELRKWEKGAAPYIHVFESGKPGPTVMVASLTHGNEVSGAVVVDALLEKGLKPRKGTLIFSFNNIEAYLSFDPTTPFKSRMVDEDFNRTWGRLDQPANTVETRRAQVVSRSSSAPTCCRSALPHDDGVPLMLAGPPGCGARRSRHAGRHHRRCRSCRRHARAMAASATPEPQERAPDRDRPALARLVGDRRQDVTARF